MWIFLKFRKIWSGWALIVMIEQKTKKCNFLLIIKRKNGQTELEIIVLIHKMDLLITFTVMGDA